MATNERAQDIENLIRQRIKHHGEWRVRRSDDVIVVYPKDIPFDGLTDKIYRLFEEERRERLEHEHPNE